jgi:hypothetical protein
MPLYDEIEPTPVAVDQIKSLPSDEPVVIVSMMRLRTDLADGRAEASWNAWQIGVEPLLTEYGITRLLDSEVVFSMVGGSKPWDVIGMFKYPNPKVLWRFMSDPRLLDLLKVRRRAAEDVHMLVLRQSPMAQLR